MTIFIDGVSVNTRGKEIALRKEIAEKDAALAELRDRVGALQAKIDLGVQENEALREEIRILKGKLFRRKVRQNQLKTKGATHDQPVPTMSGE